MGTEHFSETLEPTDETKRRQNTGEERRLFCWFIGWGGSEICNYWLFSEIVRLL